MGGKNSTNDIPRFVIREEIIPAKEYLAVEMKKGQILRFIDIEGQQVFDVTTFNFNDL